MRFVDHNASGAGAYQVSTLNRANQEGPKSASVTVGATVGIDD